jgi:hypothetical protein
VLVDTLEAVNKPVLSKVVLRIAGTIDIPLALKGTLPLGRPKMIKVDVEAEVSED